MRALFAIVLVAGLGLAAFAANMIRGYMDHQQHALQVERQAAAQRVDVVPVVAAKRAMVYGEQITREDVEIIGYAKPYLPEGTFGTLEEFFSGDEEDLRTVLRPMEPKEPFLAVKVTEPGSDAGLVTRLGHGMRAFAISTDVSSGVSGFLRPGDRVDVYWTGRLPTGDEVTRLIQPAIEIMAVDQTDDTSRSGTMIARTVTVKANPQQVAALAQAQSTGRLSLALVGVTDDTVVEAVEVDQMSLLGIEALPEPEVIAEAPQEQICTIRKRSGGEVIVTEVPCLQ